MSMESTDVPVRVLPEFPQSDSEPLTSGSADALSARATSVLWMRDRLTHYLHLRGG